METTRRIFRVDRREISYLRVIIESYDGMAVVRTVDPREALIEIQIAPGCEELIKELTDHLEERESVRLTPVQGEDA